MSHKRCNQVLSNLPTRILSIGVIGTSRIFLHEPLQSAVGRYAALSYCWGKSKNIRTTKSNFKTMKIGFTLKNLPRTMQDTIYIAWRLGIRYIWIDSLCIIQDSALDWELKSFRMASIYQNAFITIAAVASPSATIGILGLTHGKTGRCPLALDWSTDDGCQTLVKARELDPAQHSSVVSNSLLRTRGWALQKEILSTRLISFCSGELEWKCIETQTCKCHYAEVALADSHSSLQCLRAPRDAFEAWRSIVQTYSRRNLTNLHDRLPASWKELFRSCQEGMDST